VGKFGEIDMNTEKTLEHLRQMKKNMDTERSIPTKVPETMEELKPNIPCNSCGTYSCQNKAKCIRPNEADRTIANQKEQTRIYLAKLKQDATTPCIDYIKQSRSLMTEEQSEKEKEAPGCAAYILYRLAKEHQYMRSMSVVAPYKLGLHSLKEMSKTTQRYLISISRSLLDGGGTISNADFLIGVENILDEARVEQRSFAAAVKANFVSDGGRTIDVRIIHKEDPELLRAKLWSKTERDEQLIARYRASVGENND